MNPKNSFLLVGTTLLVLGLACGGGSGGGGTPTVATPVLTAPSYVSSADTTGDFTFTVTTQTQTGCSFAWTVSDPLVQIMSGQGTASLVLSGPFTADPETFQVGVTVTAGSASANAAVPIRIVDPPTTLLSINQDPMANPALINVPVSVTNETQRLGDSVDWSAIGADVTSGLGTNSITLTATAAGTVTVWCDVTDPASGLLTESKGSFPVFDPSIAKPTSQAISGPASVAVGGSGLVFSVPEQAGCNYSWGAQSGTITGGGTSASITYSAVAAGSPAVSSDVITCNIQNLGGIRQCVLTVAVAP